MTRRTKEGERGREKEPDLRLIRALAHPLRWRILQTLNLRTASPSELAGELGAPLPNIAYHVKVLARNDAIELVKTEQVRGALEHFYRATMRPWFTDETWSALPISTRRALFGEILRDIWSDVAGGSTSTRRRTTSSPTLSMRWSSARSSFTRRRRRGWRRCRRTNARSTGRR